MHIIERVINDLLITIVKEMSQEGIPHLVGTELINNMNESIQFLEFPRTKCLLPPNSRATTTSLIGVTLTFENDTQYLPLISQNTNTYANISLPSYFSWNIYHGNPSSSLKELLNNRILMWIWKRLRHFCIRDWNDLGKFVQWNWQEPKKSAQDCSIAHFPDVLLTAAIVMWTSRKSHFNSELSWRTCYTIKIDWRLSASRFKERCLTEFSAEVVQYGGRDRRHGSLTRIRMSTKGHS